MIETKHRFYTGHALDVLRGLDSDSVHCVITSPPYFGLRDYGLAPVVWGGSPICAHLWQGSACSACGAFSGCLGLESTVGQYVGNLVDVFHEVRRVLRMDGILWLILGDSYAGSGGAGGSNPIASSKQLTNRGSYSSARISVGRGLKRKDLCGVPWRVAFALQDDGWWLRKDIVWAKPNPMVASVTDRPTSGHEYVFMFTKRAKYFYDRWAAREPVASRVRDALQLPMLDGVDEWLYVGDPWRNARSVWSIVPEAYKGVHYAVFPRDLVRRCIRAAVSEHGCCPRCSAPWCRVLGRDPEPVGDFHPLKPRGWKPGCRCDGNDASVPPVVMDPFGGTGTVSLVAREMGYSSVYIDLSQMYLDVALHRIRADQMGMFELADIEIVQGDNAGVRRLKR